MIQILSSEVSLLQIIAISYLYANGVSVNASEGFLVEEMECGSYFAARDKLPLQQIDLTASTDIVWSTITGHAVYTPLELMSALETQGVSLVQRRSVLSSLIAGYHKIMKAESVILKHRIQIGVQAFVKEAQSVKTLHNKTLLSTLGGSLEVVEIEIDDDNHIITTLVSDPTTFQFRSDVAYAVVTRDVSGNIDTAIFDTEMVMSNDVWKGTLLDKRHVIHAALSPFISARYNVHKHSLTPETFEVYDQAGHNSFVSDIASLAYHAELASTRCKVHMNKKDTDTAEMKAMTALIDQCLDGYYKADYDPTGLLSSGQALGFDVALGDIFGSSAIPSDHISPRLFTKNEMIKITKEESSGFVVFKTIEDIQMQCHVMYLNNAMKFNATSAIALAGTLMYYSKGENWQSSTTFSRDEWIVFYEGFVRILGTLAMIDTVANVEISASQNNGVYAIHLTGGLPAFKLVEDMLHFIGSINPRAVTFAQESLLSELAKEIYDGKTFYRSCINGFVYSDEELAEVKQKVAEMKEVCGDFYEVN